MNSEKLQCIKLLYRLATFLYTSNELSEREVKETIPSTITLKRIKSLGINLPKEVGTQKTKTLMKETEGDTNRWKDTPCS